MKGTEIQIKPNTENDYFWNKVFLRRGVEIA